MADAVLAGTLTVIKDAQPNSAQDFHFSIQPGGAASDFDLDDDSDATLPNTVTFRVAPGNYTMQELNIPASWSLTNLVCVSTGGNTSSSNLGTATGSATVVDDGNTTCTFTNSHAASLKVDKVWKVNGVNYPEGQQPASLGLSAQLKIDGTNQGWGVTRDGFLEGDSATLDETTTIGNSLCSLDSGKVTSANGATVNGALPYNTGPLAGGLNTFTITNTVTCDAHLTLVKVVDHGNTGDTTPATAWTLTADGPTTLSGAGGAEGDVPPGSYDLSESGPTTYSASSWSCVGGTQQGASVTLGLGESATCTITNTAVQPGWDVVKTAVVEGNPYADPQHAEPGDTINFTITATKVGDGVDVFNVDVHDNLADVLDDASLTSGPTVTNGSAALNGDVIDWHINQISTTVTMTYSVLVDDDAFDETLRNVVTAPDSLNCPEGSEDPDCSTTHKTPHWVLTKTSDKPVDVMPGETITYTLTVTNDSDTDVLHAVVNDDLSQVLDNATLNLPLAAGLAINGNELTWTVPTPIAPTDQVSVSYSVTIGDHEWNAVLDNHATPGEPGGNCPSDADCTTHHETPPVTTFVVKKVDFETLAPLAGAHFILWLDKGTIGVKDAADVSLGEKVTNAAGLAKWGELLKGTYLIQETQAPPGYALPAVTIVPIVINDANFVPMGEMTPFVFEDPSVGHLAIVAKQQYEKNANGNWVLSDGITDFGSQVKYVLGVEATGTKLFHNVKVTDYIPGFNPSDTTSTLKGSLVNGSGKCSASLDCTVSVSPGHLVTWKLGTVKNDKGTVEMIVNFPKAPSPVPFNADGLYTGTLWNVGFLEWDEAIADTPGSKAVEMQHRKLRSNEVEISASLRKPPPGIVPCQVHCLPNTGSQPYLLQLGMLGGLALVAGTVLVVRRRRGEATE